MKLTYRSVDILSRLINPWRASVHATMRKSLLNKWLDIKNNEKRKAPSKSILKYPLAYNQQALYFLNQLYPDNPFYNYLDFYQFRGELELSNLIKSFEYIIDRHEVFRTRFELGDKGPVQIVEAKGELGIMLHEEATLEDDSEKKALQIIIEESRKPFDLGSAQQLRLSIVKVNRSNYYIGVCAHHIIIDKLSMSLLRKEVAYVYKQIQNNQIIDLKPFTTSFKDYSKNQIEKKFSDEALNYWLSKIDSSQEIIELPFDHQRLAIPTFKGSQFNAPLGKELSGKVRKLGLEFNVTPFVLLLSVFNILLRKYSRSNSINIGIPVTHKESTGLEDVLGFFDETLVLSTTLNQPNETFTEFVQRIKTNVYEAFDHKGIPLEVLLRKIKPSRILGVNPLFQVMFIFHKMQGGISFGDDILFESKTVDIGVSKFDLTLFIGEDDYGFYSSFEYSTDLFEKTKIEKISSHYQNVLKQVLDNPKVLISDLKLMDETERNSILRNSNGPNHSLEPYDSILELIQNQVDLVPNKLALSDENDQMTYRDMDMMSNRIAAFLIDLGCTPNEIVGLYFGRSIKMVISILGVLKAGCAYLPLDPKYPLKRISYMVEDAKVKKILTERGNQLDNSYNTISYDEIIKRTFKNTINRIINRKDLSYVIYTSGSTGSPKGVAISHLNLLNSTMARLFHYKDQPHSFLLFSSFSFDSSVAGIFWTLSCGGKLVIAAERLEQDIEKLSNVFEKECISHTLLLPSLYQAILTSINPEKMKALKNVIVAGETCPLDLPQKHFQLTKNVNLYNEYGPTEATVWATVDEVKRDNLKIITIGKPIVNTQVYILNEDLQPVPEGIIGEIYIGGLNVSGRYLNNEQENNKKFIINPFEAGEGLLYKSGDYGKIDNEGRIVYLGRADDQVKIRGHRIELDEIKNKVLNIPDVDEVVVLLKSYRRDIENEKDLLDQIKNKSPEEIEEVLSFVEKLSDAEIDYMLAEMR